MDLNGINTLSLAMKFYRQPEGYTNFLDVLNVVFTVFFTLEFLLKLAAFRFKVSSLTATLRFEGINESRSFPFRSWAFFVVRVKGNF